MTKIRMEKLCTFVNNNLSNKVIISLITATYTHINPHNNGNHKNTYNTSPIAFGSVQLCFISHFRQLVK